MGIYNNLYPLPRKDRRAPSPSKANLGRFC